MKTLILTLLLINISVFSFASEKTPLGVEFSSDTLEISEETQIMTAIGNVLIKTKDRKINADIVEYDKINDRAVASGNVKIIEKDGSIFQSEKIILENGFKNITAFLMNAKFNDQSQLKAKKFSKNKNAFTIFENASYTACDCDIEHGEKPIWKIDTETTIHDPIKKSIYHKNVVMKLFSYPIFYLPYIEHPDWTVKKRSGFLTPKIGFSKRNRFETSIPYYFTTKDNSWDTLITTHQKGKNGHLDQLNFRKKYLQTSIETDLYKGNLNTNKQDGDDVFAAKLNFKSDLNNDWQLISAGKYTDQDTFMRRYGFDNEAKYKSFVNAKKSKENRFSQIEIYNIKNLEDKKDDRNQPLILPNIFHHRFDNYKDMNYEIKLNASDVRDDEFYDIQRWTSSGYLNKFIEIDGLNINLDAETGLDLYSIKNRPSSEINENKYLDRFSLGYSISASKDFSLNSSKLDFIFEPKLQLSSIHSTDRTNSLPNRDSMDYNIDSSNLFMINKYQGRDNIQSNQSVNYGINSLLLSNRIGNIDFFVGQSQKIGGTNKNELKDNIDRQSDFITNLSWRLNDTINVHWDTLLDHHSLETNYSSFGINGKTIGYIDYSFNHNSINKNIINNDKDREEFKLSLNKNINNWKIGYNSTYDLSNDQNEQISEEIFIDYLNEYLFQNCLTLKLNIKTSGGSNDRDIEPSSSIFLTFNFKNLGEMEFKPDF